LVDAESDAARALFGQRTGVDELHDQLAVHKEKEGVVDHADLEACDPGIEAGDALIMATGWKCGDPVDYVKKGPALAYDCLEWLAQQPFSIWAADLTVANCLWAEEQGLEGEAGKDLLRDLYRRRPEMLLLAPLINLDQVTVEEGTLITLGLHVPGVRAVPAQVLFLEGARVAI